MRKEKNFVAFLVLFCMLVVFPATSAVASEAPPQETTNESPQPTLTAERSPLRKSYQLWGWNVPRYYYYQYLHLFAGYPWVVRVAYLIVLICCFGFVVLMITMGIDVYLRNRHRKFYEKIHKKYFEPLVNVVLAKVENLPTEEIKRRIDYKEKKWKDWQLRQWTYLFIEVSGYTNTLDPNLTNIQRAMAMVGVPIYVEKRLVHGRSLTKARVIQAVRLTNMEIPNSVMASLINDKRPNLRTAARLYYMATSKVDPFFFFEEERKQNVKFTIWGRMEVHEVLDKWHQAGRKAPAFIPMMQKVENVEIVVFLIYETAYWGTENEVRYLTQYFDSENFRYRHAAFRSMGIRQFKDAEPQLKKVYFRQTESLRRVILESLLAIDSGNSTNFFAEAYEQTTSDFTKRVALRCLYKYGPVGRRLFQRMKARTDEHSRILFEHVENPIINKEIEP